MFTYDNIRLRKAAPEDLPKLFWLKQESWFGTHHVTIINEEDQKRWFESLDKHPHSPRDLVLMAQNEKYEDFGVFKILHIDYINRNASVGWDVFQYFRGKGLGKRLVQAGVKFAFSVLNLHRLDAEILGDNAASEKCAKHVGFLLEGVRREAVHKDGFYIDSLVFGLLRSECSGGCVFTTTITAQTTEANNV